MDRARVEAGEQCSARKQRNVAVRSGRARGGAYGLQADRAGCAVIDGTAFAPAQVAVEVETVVAGDRLRDLLSDLRRFFIGKRLIAAEARREPLAELAQDVPGR